MHKKPLSKEWHIYNFFAVVVRTVLLFSENTVNDLIDNNLNLFAYTYCAHL